jgi:hypothetical protein
MADWLELELAEELRPVAAPDELWERIRAADGRQVVRAAGGREDGTMWAMWPIAAIVTLAVAAATLWLVAKGQGPALDLRQLAIVELRGHGQMELASSDPSEINEWMRREAGVELALPARSSAHLTGARVIQRSGVRVGAVSYRVGGDTAVLLVAPAAMPASDAGHGHAAWQSHGQSYALASSSTEHSEAACLLCHASL